MKEGKEGIMMRLPSKLAKVKRGERRDVMEYASMQSGS